MVIELLDDIELLIMHGNTVAANSRLAEAFERVLACTLSPVCFPVERDREDLALWFRDLRVLTREDTITQHIETMPPEECGSFARRLLAIAVRVVGHRP